MVFVLRHVLQGVTAILGPENRYSLGRSRRNHILLADVTASNRHATLEVVNGDVDIIDEGSDFGTWVNRQRISEPFKLRHGDVIVFGKGNCKYVFLDPKFQVLVDHNVSNRTKTMVAQTLKDLKVSLTEKYSGTSTHFVIESVSLKTLKEKSILYYLIDRKTVVTPQYFDDILTNIKEAPPMPNIYKYMPEIDNYLKSRGIEDIKPRMNRRYIFEHIVFIFFDKKCDEELCDLIIKCGGEAIVYSQKKSFYHALFNSMGRYQYVAVNHNKNNKKVAPMYVFLRTMRQKKKKVVEINSDDVYVSVLKGELVAVCEISLPDSPKEAQRRTSKTSDYVVLNCSEDEMSGAESEPVDIVCKVTKVKKSSGKKDVAVLNTFGRMTAAYKQHKSLREVILDNKERSPTLNKWITRKKKTDNNVNQRAFENAVTVNRTEECNEDLHTNGSSNEEVQDTNRSSNAVDYDKVMRDLEEIFGTSEETNEKTYACSSPITKKKRTNNIVGEMQETMCTDSDSPKRSPERLNSKTNGKRRSVVINPFAVRQPPKIVEDAGNNASIEKWMKKYKNVEIIPMA